MWHICRQNPHCDKPSPARSNAGGGLLKNPLPYCEIKQIYRNKTAYNYCESPQTMPSRIFFTVAEFFEGQNQVAHPYKAYAKSHQRRPGNKQKIPYRAHLPCAKLKTSPHAQGAIGEHGDYSHYQHGENFRPLNFAGEIFCLSHNAFCKICLGCGRFLLGSPRILPMISRLVEPILSGNST